MTLLQVYLKCLHKKTKNNNNSEHESQENSLSFYENNDHLEMWFS